MGRPLFFFLRRRTRMGQRRYHVGRVHKPVPPRRYRAGRVDEPPQRGTAGRRRREGRDYKNGVGRRYCVGRVDNPRPPCGSCARRPRIFPNNNMFVSHWLAYNEMGVHKLLVFLYFSVFCEGGYTKKQSREGLSHKSIVFCIIYLVKVVSPFRGFKNAFLHNKVV